MSIYENISLNKILLRRPLRVILNAWSAFISGPKTCKPFKIKFESVAGCNLKCIMCPLTKGIDRKKGFLKFNNFKKVYDEIKVPYLNLTGLGEPLLNPDLFKIIRYARAKGSMVKLDTNAMLLTKNRIIELIHSDPTFISISIDGLTKKSYEKIRVGANFETVLENLKNLIEYRNKIHSKVKIHLFFVLQKENLEDFIDFIKFGEKIGIDAINGTIAMSFGKAKNNDKINIGGEKLEKIRKDYYTAKKQFKVVLNMEGIEEYFKDPKNISKSFLNKPCFYPWYNPCVTWDGYVVPCDVHCDNEIVLGNAFEEPFMKIWNNKTSQNFRKQLLKKRVGVCSTCFVDESFILEKLKILYKIPILKKLSFRK